MTAQQPTGRLQISSALLARSTLFNLAGQALPFVIGLASLPAIVHGLGTERFGLLVLTWTFIGAFSVFDLGLGWAVTRFAADALGRGQPHALPGIIWPAVAGQAVMGAVGGSLLATITPQIVQWLNVAPSMATEAILTFRIVGLSLPVVLVSVSFRGALEAAQRFDIVAGFKTASSAATFLVPLGSVVFGATLPGILLALLLVRVLLLGVLVFACARVLTVLAGPVHVSRERLRLQFAFGGWIMVSALAGLVLAHADRLLIGNRLTMTALTNYTVPQEMVARLSVIAANLSAVLFPAFSALAGAEEDSRLALLFGRTAKYVVLMAGPVFGLIAILASDLLRVWLGPDLAGQSAPVLQILAIGAGFQLFAIVPYTLLQGLGRSDLTAKIHLVEAPLYLAALWWLVGIAGIRGAAIAWAGRAAIELLLLYWVSDRLLGWTWRTTGFAVRRAVVSVVGLCVAVALIFALPIVLFYKAVLLLAVFVFFVWRVWMGVLDSDDRRWMLRLAPGWKDGR